MINLSKDAYTINPGERIGQLVLNRVDQMDLVEVVETLLKEKEERRIWTYRKIIGIKTARSKNGIDR